MLFKSIANVILTGCEKVYALGLSFKQGKYLSNPSNQKKVNAYVISVGNITWGGTGKTPLTIMLAMSLKSMGRRVAVLTRGYGDDECHELRDRLRGIPVLVGKDRLRLAEEAVNKHRCDTLILDDGYQYLALRRDMDVVTLNATNPFGNGSMIPKGSLREPVQHLSRADVIVITQSFFGRHQQAWLRQKIKEINPKATVFESDHEPSRLLDFRRNRGLPLGMVRGQKVAVLSGIEDSHSFESTVNRLGCRVAFAARFNDHHAYKTSDLDEVFKSCRDLRVRYLITTSKDYYRLRKILKPQNRHPIRILVLQIDLKIDDEEVFVNECLKNASQMKVEAKNT